MEFSAEFIEANGLNEDQVTALNSHVKDELIPTLKKDYDGVANKNAEGILSGASDYAKSIFKVDVERDQGEKFGDYLKRISDLSSTSATSALALKRQELDDKIANFKGGEVQQAEIERLTGEVDIYKQQVAELEPLKGMDEKYNTATQEMSALKKQVAYGSVKPNFPETVNKFEADAKWKSFTTGIEEKYNLEIVDGKAIAIDKENEHKRYDLATLVEQDETIKQLLEGRQQGGTGGTPADFETKEGVPFKIPKNATPEELTELVREHIKKELGSFTHPEFADKFQELYLKVKK